MSLHRLARALRSVIPDPFAIAIGLTLVALSAALINGVWLGDLTASELIEAWVNGYVPADAPPGTKGLGGLWSMLLFSMQMALILVTGYVVASTRPVRWVLGQLARLPWNTSSAVVLISLVAMGLALLNWGLGLIGGALLAREVGIAMRERGVDVHYPLLAAAGYTGLAVWHGGLSGSAPLKVTHHSNVVEVLGDTLSQAIDVIPTTLTIGSWRNLVITGAVVVVIPIVLVMLVPRKPSDMLPPPERAPQHVASSDPAPGIAGVLEDGPWLTIALALLISCWMGPWLWRGGLTSLTPDSINLVFLMLGLLLAGSPRRYMRLAKDGAAACAGIVVQFPIYGGILALLAAGGIVDQLAQALPTSGSALALTTFLSAGVLNLFVPSGGGQWAVQGPIVMQAAVQNGVAPERIVMALAYGDQWTNLFQPFWALPLLGITGTKAGDILGATAVLGVVVGVVFALGVAFL